MIIDFKDIKDYPPTYPKLFLPVYKGSSSRPQKVNRDLLWTNHHLLSGGRGRKRA